MDNKKILIPVTLVLLSVIAILSITSCGDNINCIDDPYFDSDGRLYGTAAYNGDSDSLRAIGLVNVRTYLEEEQPSAIKFYIEVSGSMNGFFRANLPTEFKKCVWSVFSDFSDWTNQVSILSNDGEVSGSLKMMDFKRFMDTGAFVSNAETKVPTMLENIIKDVDINRKEVAVLVSDMKYSPVGDVALGVLLESYTSDIRNIVSKSNAAYCLIASTSRYLDKTGCTVEANSPYYYLIIGDSEQVVWMRNRISTLLEHDSAYIDAIECGLDYGSARHDFGTPFNAIRLANEPTFYGAIDPCVIPLTIDITNFPWSVASENYMKEHLYCDSTIMGAEVQVGKVTINDNKQFDNQLQRKATATIELNVSNMLTDADVVLWTLELPDGQASVNERPITQFFGAQSENELDKSFSIENFIDGMFRGASNKMDKEPNRILISKNG